MGEKGEYQKQVESKLKGFKQKLEELKGKAGELKQEAKEEFDQGMKELQKKGRGSEQEVERIEIRKHQDLGKNKGRHG